MFKNLKNCCHHNNFRGRVAEPDSRNLLMRWEMVHRIIDEQVLMMEVGSK